MQNNRYCLLGLLLSLFVMLPSMIWIFYDSRIWPWDQAWYGEVANDLWYLLTTDPEAWLAGMMKLLQQKPPLLSWLGQFFVPLGLFLGKSEFALLVLNVSANILTLYLLWIYALRVTTSSLLLPFLSVLSAGSMPLFVGMGHQFMTESLQALIIIGSFILLAKADDIRLARLTILILLLVFLGFAVKTTSLAYNGLAVAFLAWVMLSKWRRGERFFDLKGVDIVLASLTAIFAALTISWYVINFDGMMQHVRNVLDVSIASHYGSISSFPVKALFWLHAFDNGSSLLPYAGLLVFCLASLLVLASIPRIIRFNDYPGIAALLALFHIALVLVQFMFQIMEETRFITGLMPMMVIVLVYGISRLGFLKFVQPALVVCMIVVSIVQLITVHLIAANETDFVSPTVWLKPVVLKTNQRQVADEIIGATCQPDKKDRYVVVGIDEPEMNANSLAFHAAKARNVKGYRCYYTGLGYAAVDIEPVVARVEQIRPEFVLVPSAEKQQDNPNYLNKVVAPFAARIRTDGRYQPVGDTIDGYIVYDLKD